MRAHMHTRISRHPYTLVPTRTLHKRILLHVLILACTHTCTRSHLVALALARTHTCTYSHPHTPTFLHFPTRTDSYALPLACTHTHKHLPSTVSYSLSHAFAHSHTCMHSPCTVSHTHSYSFAHSHRRTHVHLHACAFASALSRTHLYPYTLARMHTLTFVHTHNIAHSCSRTNVQFCGFLIQPFSFSYASVGYHTLLWVVHSAFIFSDVFAKRRRFLTLPIRYLNSELSHCAKLSSNCISQYAL